MLATEKKDMLRIIFGEDLETVGDVVIARNKDDNNCQVITSDGELLVQRPVLGLGYLLGPRGFHYVTLDGKRAIKRERRRMSSSYRNPNLKNFNFDIASSAVIDSGAEETEYNYSIFNSNFECEAVGRSRIEAGFGDYKKMRIDLLGKVTYVYVRDCIITEERPSYF